jgi:DNA polymerase III epsilon subunit-like protein
MARFEAWLASVTPRGNRPIFLAFNAPFDWMFVCDYFHRFLDRNPFGYAALDIKAFYMGFTGSSWAGTSMDALTARYPEIKSLNHHALDDAEDQADIFIRLLSEAGM